MLSLAIVLGQSDDLTLQLERALGRKILEGPAFHQTLNSTLKKNGLWLFFNERRGGGVKRTLGDPSSRLVWITRGGNDVSLLLISPADTGVRVRRLEFSESRGLFMLFGQGHLEGERLVLCGFLWDGSNVCHPGIWEFRQTDGEWNLKGHVLGTGEAVRPGTRFGTKLGKIDPNVVMASVRVYPDYLDTAHAGPHLREVQTYNYDGDRYRLRQTTPVPTAYRALDELSGLRSQGNRKEFDRRVPVSIRRKLWAALGEKAEMSAYPSVFVTDELRSTELSINGKLNVLFEQRKGRMTPILLFKSWR